MAFAVYENSEKGYGLCYNNKCRPLPNVISTVAVTWRPPPNSISVVALGHRQSVIWQWPIGYRSMATAEMAFSGGHRRELFSFLCKICSLFLLLYVVYCPCYNPD